MYSLKEVKTMLPSKAIAYLTQGSLSDLQNNVGYWCCH